MQGKEQVIKVHYKTLLIKTMAALGVTTPPVFLALDCGVEGFKVSINLDLSFGNESNMTLIEGKPFP